MFDSHTLPASAVSLHESRWPLRDAGRVDLIIVGARGQVGSALRRQLACRQAWLREHEDLDLRLVLAFDRHGVAHDLQGLAAADVDADTRRHDATEVADLLESACEPRDGRLLLVDCTASDEVADWYPRLLGAGVGVVTANKRANARALSHYRRLQALARSGAAPYRYETTVGAAIPVLGPIRDMRLRGERIESLQGVLSGSLSHVLHRLHEGLPFSQAVAEARALGLTEPDPFEDLAARDLLRKLLVLAREAGFALEHVDVQVEPLSTGDPAGSVEQRLAALRLADAAWRERVDHARGRGERLVVVAQADSRGGRIGVRSLPADSPLATLLPGQNLVQVRSQWQSQSPLVLAGPGAGAEVTAAGVLSDVIQAARELTARVR